MAITANNKRFTKIKNGAPNKPNKSLITGCKFAVSNSGNKKAITDRLMQSNKAVCSSLEVVKCKWFSRICYLCLKEYGALIHSSNLLIPACFIE
ncbi:hypothetical protein PES01_11030 [Pseudoalteromonas espejiana]|uniref:Uncharacterized protein n=1 Tax=Pseudoalteromonas espejiana TaxID=28107 RepID=A0A510XTA0_9GAMM|nr:hypothetical protein PES01_11030 [Pseudoalteromonas espejiana]